MLDGTKKRYVLSIVRDITDRKKTEEKLKINEQWFRTIFNAEPECVKILSPDGNLIDMNPAGLRMINAEDPDILIGQNLLCLVHEDFKEQYQRFIKELLEGKESSLEFKIKTFSGDSLWVDSHGTLIKDDDGKIKALLIVTRDITEKKHLQEELEKKVKERTEHLQRIINTMAEREVKMAELKEIIKQLKKQLKEAGLEPEADNSSKENDTV
jgi:PAS domain S-box-containing protein